MKYETSHCPKCGMRPRLERDESGMFRYVCPRPACSFHKGTEWRQTKRATAELWNEMVGGRK